MKTCTHLHDTGEHCNSAAAVNRDYCVFHLRYRARQHRMAQYRARSERFDLKLPPIESMSTVLSALNQLVEAVAADMIDLKRADLLLKSLRFAAQALKSSDKWQPSVYHSDVAAPAINLEADYGLPEGIDVNTPPEVAFPPPQPTATSEFGWPIPPSFGGVGLSDGRPIFSSCDRAPLIPDIPPPVVRDYTAEAELAMSEVTPEDIELTELYNTEGYKAMERRGREHQRSADRKRQRKLFRANYARYVAEAKLKNIQRAAEKLLADRLAAEKAAAQQEAAQKAAPTPDAGCPIPPSVGGVGTKSDTTRKPVASVDAAPGDTFAAQKEATIA